MTEFQPTPQTPEQVDEGLRNAFRQAIKDGVMDATPYLKQMTFNTDIQKTEKEIAVLQKKLELLKEMEKHKSPVEEAYKDWWGQYPELETDSEYDEMRWQGFRAGYHFAYVEKVVEEEPEGSLKFQLGKSLEDILYDWWSDVFVTHSDWDMETSISDLVDRIELFLPKSQSAEGSQSFDSELLVEGWNNCISVIKGKLR